MLDTENTSRSMNYEPKTGVHITSTSRSTAMLSTSTIPGGNGRVAVPQVSIVTLLLLVLLLRA